MCNAKLTKKRELSKCGARTPIGVKLRSDWHAFGVNFLFLLGTHAAIWVQLPLKNETHASNLRLMARQSERSFSKIEDDCQKKISLDEY